MPKRARRRTTGLPPARGQAGALTELAEAADEVLLGLGEGITPGEAQAVRGLPAAAEFACVCPPQQTKLLVCLKANPEEVDLVPGFTRDVTGLGHHGTGDLEVQSARSAERDDLPNRRFLPAADGLAGAGAGPPPWARSPAASVRSPISRTAAR